MSISVVVGAADQAVAYGLTSLLREVDDVSVLDVADTPARLEDIVLRRDPAVVLVHERLGRSPVLQTVRDLVVRRPELAVILLVEEATADVYMDAMDAGARGVLAYPASLEDITSRVQAAAQWSTQVRRRLVNGPGEGVEAVGRGRLITVVGAKGGVGTTTIATHLAYDVVRTVPGQSVCLVELDLEKGDLRHLLGISHRLDVSDLAKVADDLTATTVASAVHRDAGGLAVLLSPEQLEDVGLVGDRETRQILAALRRQFDLVVVDAGSHVTPVSAAAVELADETVLVSTPDVLALRGVHRATAAWARLRIRKAEDVRLVLNRTSKSSEIQPDAAARLVPTPLTTVTLPACFRRLEPGLNQRDPAEVRDRVWWTAIGRLADEVGMVPTLGTRSTTTNGTQAPDEWAAAAQRPSTGSGSMSRATNGAQPTNGQQPNRRRGLLRLRGESGQASLEFVGVFPAIVLIAIVIWQAALWGVTAVLAGHAADEGARAASIGQPVSATALESVPSWFRSDMSVSSGGDNVTVRARLPILAPGISTAGFVFTADVDVVREPV